MRKNFWIKIKKLKKRVNRRKLAFSLIINNKQAWWEPLTLTTWSIDDYKNQWIQGLSRLKTQNNSCLVTCFNHLPGFELPGITTLDIFKKDKTLSIQPRIFASDEYRSTLREKIYNAETCYDFIQPIETHNIHGYELLYWTCKYDEQEINQLIEELKKDTSK